MDKYVRLCNTVNTTGDIVLLEEITNSDKLKKHLKTAPGSDWYTSVYNYPIDALSYFREHDGSIRGYTGPATSDKIVFDFDSEKDVELAKIDATELLVRLNAEGIDVGKSCIIYFSGHKGFHIELYTNNEYTPDKLKAICKGIAGDLQTFDTVIYNITRLYRLPNTKHKKTGLYKIPISPKDFYNCTIEDIKSIAKKPLRIPYFPIPDEGASVLDKYAKTKPKPLLVSSDKVEDINSIDFDKCPRHVPRCIYALQQGIMKPGERNLTFLRLAAYYKNQGLDRRVTYRVLKGVAELNAERYPESEPVGKDELWETVISSVYNESWKQVPGASGTSKDNEMLKKYCDSIEHERTCTLHGDKTNKVSIVRIDQVANGFQKFAENFDNNVVKTGINLIDDYMKIAVGTTTLLSGACGSGKTSALLSIMENANKIKQPTMFFSLDMNRNLVYLKLAQKLTKYSQEDILKFYKTRDKRKIEEIKRVIKENYAYTFFDFSATLTMDEMKNRILAAQDKSGMDIRVTAIDYASRISGPFSDTYANARYNALKSTEAAVDTDTAFLIVTQVSRQTGNGQTPLRTKRAAKESGDWEETASNVITMWRPFMGVEDCDDVIRLFLAKNRMGKEIERPLWWNGPTGSIKDMTEEEYLLYKEEREQAERELLRRTFRRD